jgi:polyisoprenoid-binding protein YceI
MEGNMKIQKVLLAVVVIAAATVALAADVYELDPAHSRVGFSVRHMMLSDVEGSFGEFSGKIELDGTDVAQLKASGVVKAASINTENKDRDAHLRSPDFFDAAKYPEITFQSRNVEKRGGQYVLLGDLTMHGVTKEIPLTITMAGPIADMMGKSRIAVKASATINRQDFGVKWSKTLDNGGLVVGDEVNIAISTEAVQQAPAPQAPAAAPAARAAPAKPAK